METKRSPAQRASAYITVCSGGILPAMRPTSGFTEVQVLRCLKAKASLSYEAFRTKYLFKILEVTATFDNCVFGMF